MMTTIQQLEQKIGYQVKTLHVFNLNLGKNIQIQYN